MRILRTDDSRFKNLPDYPFSPNYARVDTNLRLHYLDQGPAQAAPVIMLHGEPSWSFLYRHMIPPVAAAGHRVLAPDLIGFGKSDKPASRRDYSHDRHLQWLERWLIQLDLWDITLVCQNLSSLLGLHLVARHPRRFARIITGNAVLPVPGSAMPTALSLWHAFATYSPWFPIARLIQLGTARSLSAAELAAYEAPFPSARHKNGAKAFPGLFHRPGEAMPTAATWSFLKTWHKPFITCFSSGDPVTRGGERPMQRWIPGAHGQPHITLRGGHFLQEDAPADFARVIIDACKSDMAIQTPRRSAG